MSKIVFDSDNCQKLSKTPFWAKFTLVTSKVTKIILFLHKKGFKRYSPRQKNFWPEPYTQHSGWHVVESNIKINNHPNFDQFLVFDSIWQFKPFLTVYDRFLTGVMSKTLFDCQKYNSGDINASAQGESKNVQYFTGMTRKGVPRSPKESRGV